MEHHALPNTGTSLADFICTLQTNLATVPLGQPLLDSDAIAALDREISHNPFSAVSSSGLDLKRLDVIGTSLWNTCSQLIAKRGNIPADAQILAKVRAIAFALLNLAVPSKLSGWLRSISLALTAAQTCIATEQLDTALNILTVAAGRLYTVQPSHSGLDSSLKSTLDSKYWLLRVRLAAAQKRLDIAEHLWSKVPHPFSLQDCQMVLETCFLVGDCTILTAPASALLWLQRAHEALQHLDVVSGMKFPAYNDWNLVIDHSIAATCCLIKTPESNAVLTEKLNNLKGMHMYHPAVVLFDHTLEIAEPDINRALLAFQHTVVTMNITDANMTTLFSFVRHLGRQNDQAGMEAMNSLLLLPLPTREWTEKCFIAFTMLLARSKELDSTQIQSLQGVMEALDHRGYPSISAGAAQAIVMCLWKMSGAAVLNNDYTSAVDWLRICNDPKIFTNCNEATQILIHRKLIACYVQSGDLVAARNLLSRGLIQNRMDCKGMYLSYKLALWEGKDCTDSFRLAFPKQPILHKQTSLLSCALEAQRLHKPAELLSCLHQLLLCSAKNDIYHDDFSAAEHHMFLICLVLKELDEYCTETFYDRVGTVLDDALEYARDNNRFGVSELDVSASQIQWLYHASYVVGLKLLWHRKLPLLLKTMKCAHEFILLYRQVAEVEGRSARAPRPHFFAINHVRILAYADEARIETDLDTKRLHYRCVRACFQVLGNLTGWEDGEEDPTQVTNALEDRRHIEARFHNFEATLHLGLWDELIEICDEEQKFPNAQYYPEMIDMIFQVNPPPTVTVKLMKRIVYSLIKILDDHPMDLVRFRMRMPRYLHALFSLASANVQEHPDLIGITLPRMVDPELAEEVLEKIYQLAKTEDEKEIHSDPEANMNTLQNGTEIYTIGGKNPFPPQELQQIALVAFDKAVDFYHNANDMDSFFWALKAIDVAGLVPGSEGEKLVELLEERHFNLF